MEKSHPLKVFPVQTVSELFGLKPSVLLEGANAIGVKEEELDSACDEDNVKKAIIALILKRAQIISLDSSPPTNSRRHPEGLRFSSPEFYEQIHIMEKSCENLRVRVDAQYSDDDTEDNLEEEEFD